MQKLCAVFLLCICCLCACSAGDSVDKQKDQGSTQHEHTPNGADCQHVQYCADCGEMLGEQGEHDYPDTPDDQADGYSFYTCRICGQSKIINEDGLPVIPVE